MLSLASNLLAMASNLIASLLLVAMPFVPSSFLLLVVRPGAPSRVLAPSSDALVTRSAKHALQGQSSTMTRKDKVDQSIGCTSL